MPHKRQHIISKTYLKHFSSKNDGKGLYVLEINNDYKTKIEIKNSGDSIFWGKYFYRSSEFQDPNILENFFSQKIENEFNKIIRIISNQKEIVDLNFKKRLFEWIFYSKLKSPGWREFLKEILQKEKVNTSVELPDPKKEHLDLFLNNEKLEFLVEYYLKSLVCKKWKILISTNNNWITSDNPGYSININEIKKNLNTYIPNPLWTKIQFDTLLYFPLSKKYCLKIEPYRQNDKIELNLYNDSISFENSNPQEINIVNDWTGLTAYNLLISCNIDELNKYQQIIKE